VESAVLAHREGKVRVTRVPTGRLGCSRVHG
jgi:hypothetical protein